VLLELPDLKDPKVLPVSLDPLEVSALRDLLVLQDIQVLLGRLAHKEYKDFQEALEQQDLKGRRDLRVLLDSQVPLDPRALRVYKDLLESLVLPVLLVHREHKDHQVSRDSLEALVPKALPESRVARVRREHKDRLGSLETQDLRDHQESPDLLDLKVRREAPV
jgi:hypothetical protein